MALQVIHDGNGRNTGVFIPYNEWNKLKKQYKDLEILEQTTIDEISALENIKTGLQEVRLFKKGKLKTIPAKDFLNEL